MLVPEDQQVERAALAPLCPPDEFEVALCGAGPTAVTGYAWSGYGEIATVEVSADGGENWQPANLERAGRRAWVRFTLPWDAAPGQHTILARATDERRLRQPVQAAWNLKGYGQNGIHVVTVTVE